MKEFEIIFYDKEDGTEPAKDFLLSLDTKMRAKVMRTLSLLEKKGHLLREPYSKFLTDDIFEIRTTVGNNTTRILYFFIVGNKIVLTNGFIKKRQKTPRKEIELAKKYRHEYLNRGVK